MSSKKWSRRLRNISTAKSIETDEEFIEDLFGMDLNGNATDETDTAGGVPSKKKPKKKTYADIPDNVLKEIFGYLKQMDLMSLRLVNRSTGSIATQVFLSVHTPIQIKTEDDVFRFRQDLDTSSSFPFSRFSLVLQHIKRHLLINFTERYEEHIKCLKLEPFDKDGDGARQQILEPSQRPLHKLTGIIQELSSVEELDIIFPTFSEFDYQHLSFEKDYTLEDLRVFSVGFGSMGFSKFSRDLTISILDHAENLEKLKLKLPEPSNPREESQALQQVIHFAAHVPFISVTLSLNTNGNVLLETLRQVVASGMNTQIRTLILNLGIWFTEYNVITKMLQAMTSVLRRLVVNRRSRRGESIHCQGQGQEAPLHFPYMQTLRHLAVDSYRIPVTPILLHYFPNLTSLELHLKYGDDEFYRRSCLHPLEKLKLEFHETSIFKVLPPESALDNLVSRELRKLELVNPPIGHLTFMSNWGKKIETFVVSAPSAYGGLDPTYTKERIFGQLSGSTQYRERAFNHVGQLHKLGRLKLHLPIDERMADYLADFPRLWELVVDDSEVSEESIGLMRNQHHIYISWRPSI